MSGLDMCNPPAALSPTRIRWPLPPAQPTTCRHTMLWPMSCASHNVCEGIIWRQVAGCVGIGRQTVSMRLGAACGVSIGQPRIVALRSFRSTSLFISPGRELVLVVRQLLHAERGRANSAGNTVIMRLGAASRASGMFRASAQNHAVTQVGHGKAICGYTITKAPRRIMCRFA